MVSKEKYQDAKIWDDALAKLKKKDEDETDDNKD